MKAASLQSQLDRLPPCLCRLMARAGSGSQWRPKSHREIALAAKLPRQTVADLSRRTSWANIPIHIADRFAFACGVNLAQINDTLSRLRLQRTRLRHLSSGNAHQRRMIATLMIATLINLNQKSKSPSESRRH